MRGCSSPGPELFTAAALFSKSSSHALHHFCMYLQTGKQLNLHGSPSPAGPNDSKTGASQHGRSGRTASLDRSEYAVPSNASLMYRRRIGILLPCTMHAEQSRAALEDALFNTHGVLLTLLFELLGSQPKHARCLILLFSLLSCLICLQSSLTVCVDEGPCRKLTYMLKSSIHTASCLISLQACKY